MALIYRIGNTLKTLIASVGNVASSNIETISDTDWGSTPAPTQLTTPTNFAAVSDRNVDFSWDAPISTDDAYVGSWEIWGGSGSSTLLASITHTTGSTTDNTHTESLVPGTYYYSLIAISNGTPLDSVHTANITVVVV